MGGPGTRHLSPSSPAGEVVPTHRGGSAGAQAHRCDSVHFIGGKEVGAGQGRPPGLVFTLGTSVLLRVLVKVLPGDLWGPGHCIWPALQEVTGLSRREDRGGTPHHLPVTERVLGFQEGLLNYGLNQLRLPHTLSSSGVRRRNDWFFWPGSEVPQAVAQWGQL